MNIQQFINKDTPMQNVKHQLFQTQRTDKLTNTTIIKDLKILQEPTLFNIYLLTNMFMKLITLIFNIVISKINIILILSVFYALSYNDNKIIHILIFIGLSLFFYICFLYFKYYQYISSTNSYLIDSHLPIQYIAPFKKRNYTFEEIRKMIKQKLKLSPKMESELATKVHLFVTNHKQKKYSGGLFVGAQGTGKTEIATLLCKLCGGGYMVSIGSLALMGLKGVEILNKVIHKVSKKKQCLFLDDGEIIMKMRDANMEVKLKTKDINIINPNAQIQLTPEEQALQNQHMLFLIINTFLAATGSHNISFIITSNIAYNMKIEPAIYRRLLIHVLFKPDNTQSLNILNLYANKYNIKLNFEKYHNLLTKLLNGFSARDIQNFCLSYSYMQNYNIMDFINAIQSVAKYTTTTRELINTLESQIYKEYVTQE